MLSKKFIAEQGATGVEDNEKSSKGGYQSLKFKSHWSGGCCFALQDAAVDNPHL